MDPDWLTTSPAVLHVESKLGLPDYVKTAAWTPASDLPLEAFADLEQRLPIYSKAAAWCSAVWCAANQELVDDPTWDRVKQAVEAHDVAPDLSCLVDLFGQRKEAAAAPEPDHTYALTLKNARQFGFDVDTLELLPLSNELDVEDSIRELDKAASLGKLPPELVREAAVATKQAADLFGVPVPQGSTTLRLGVERLADFDKAAELVERRSSVVPADVMQHYRDIVDFLKTAGMEEDTVDALRDLDASQGITYGFGKLAYQPTPWEIVYSGPTEKDLLKLASTSLYIASCLVPVEALKAVADRDLDMKLAADTAALIKQARTMDAPHAAALIDTLDETRQLQVLDLLVSHAG